MEAFVKRENAERKSESDAINKVLNAENDKRMKEAAALKDKMEKEKREMQVKYTVLSYRTLLPRPCQLPPSHCYRPTWRTMLKR